MKFAVIVQEIRRNEWQARSGYHVYTATRIYTDLALPNKSGFEGTFWAGLFSGKSFWADYG